MVVTNGLKARNSSIRNTIGTNTDFRPLVKSAEHRNYLKPLTGANQTSARQSPAIWRAFSPDISDFTKVGNLNSCLQMDCFLQTNLINICIKIGNSMLHRKGQLVAWLDKTEKTSLFPGLTISVLL